MAVSNPDTIEIRDRIIEDGRKCLQARDLYIDGCRRASMEQRRDGAPLVRFYPSGRFGWEESKVWVLGLVQLLIMGEEFKDVQG